MAAAGDTTHCLRQQQRETPLGYHPRIFKDMFWEEEMLAPRCVGRDVLCARAQLNCAVARVRFARRQAGLVLERAAPRARGGGAGGA